MSPAEKQRRSADLRSISAAAAGSGSDSISSEDLSEIMNDYLVCVDPGSGSGPGPGPGPPTHRRGRCSMTAGAEALLTGAPLLLVTVGGD